MPRVGSVDAPSGTDGPGSPGGSRAGNATKPGNTLKRHVIETVERTRPDRIRTDVFQRIHLSDPGDSPTDADRLMKGAEPDFSDLSRTEASNPLPGTPDRRGHA